MDQAPQRKQIRFYSAANLDELQRAVGLSPRERHVIEVVSQVLPFKVNNHVVESLIDWAKVPEDPVFQMTFPQEGMLRPAHFARMSAAVQGGQRENIRRVADSIRQELNPHPGGQLTDNQVALDGEIVPGVQHKYIETCLVFPSVSQTCHSYCSYCFRWAQFVGDADLRFATDKSMRYVEYLRQHREISDVLFTGGDPMFTPAAVLSRYIEPLLGSDFDHIQTIRIGSKSLSYWPYRFLTDSDADAMLGLFERVVRLGKHLSFMAHFTHGQELQPQVVADAIRRIRNTGAVIRTQAPLLRHVNDDAAVWIQKWKTEVRLGCVPYYMFVERDTGACNYFKVPLSRAAEIFQTAARGVSGLAATVRGPVMSTLPGKVMIEGVAEVAGRRVFVLSFLRARSADWCRRPFFAEYDPSACWLSDLRPAFPDTEFFYERELTEMQSERVLPRPVELDDVAPGVAMAQTA